MKKCFVHCSYCGKQVSNVVESYLDEGMVVRAIVVCLECLTEHLPDPNASYLRDHNIDFTKEESIG